MAHHDERMAEHRRRMDSIAATSAGTPIVDTVNHQVEREKERKIAKVEFENMEEDVNNDEEEDEDEEEQRENVKRAKYEEIMAHHEERMAEHLLRMKSIAATSADFPLKERKGKQLEREKERKIAQMELENTGETLEEDEDEEQQI